MSDEIRVELLLLPVIYFFIQQSIQIWLWVPMSSYQNTIYYVIVWQNITWTHRQILCESNFWLTIISWNIHNGKLFYSWKAYKLLNHLVWMLISLCNHKLPIVCHHQHCHHCCCVWTLFLATGLITECAPSICTWMIASMQPVFLNGSYLISFLFDFPDYMVKLRAFIFGSDNDQIAFIILTLHYLAPVPHYQEGHECDERIGN